ncbi:ribbon-helix-helix protein, CopG family [Nocardia asteroides NBRC 15531]|nr:ribbon-helix-helix protein, CopG family [Nocardia asteroides]TLF65425.1 ribbon-helix-helix protein, CopG family [Nocardia asteroides NBRC 15531]UGT47819.1 ribbon-helix-helix protein, CopG family [Nocardia asteroides]SFM56606.1 Ribbon-helix-helix protein, copG family [Nocardia asteroides]VEG33254.1 Ribbon-helix-helix protein, copG family [Nocardia asteroides]
MAWTMRLTDEEEAALAAQAEDEGRSKNEIMRDALRAYLLRNRIWETPLLGDDETFDLGGPIGKDDIHDAMNRSA